MMIKTKIVATVGPASRDVPVLTKLVKAGVDVFRINFSHGTLDEHEQILKNIRRVSDDLGEPLAVIADLCGPKIRVGKVCDGGALLEKGAEIIIQRKPVVGNAKRISTTLPELIDRVRKGQKIRLDDGKIELEVIRSASASGDKILCRVVTGGILSSGKGINLPKTNLALSALTQKDRADAKWIAQRDFDYVALSFVQKSADVKALRKILAGAGSEARIVAKIEKPQAVKNIDAIIAAADGILVARGDMGVEMSLPEVPLVQKRLARLCAETGKSCIIATQMLETMTDNPIPTRAEVSD
ncbi:MAG: pyruvate kinase, partial [Phycisphaerae bacterium]|nr:pyruvate kinase [Phycisphaerae bacterium]